MKDLEKKRLCLDFSFFSNKDIGQICYSGFATFEDRISQLPVTRIPSVYGEQYRNNTQIDSGLPFARGNATYERRNEENVEQFLQRIESIIYQLEQISSTHIRWRTHKNPYGCWICELVQLSRILANQLRSVNGQNTRRSGKLRKVSGTTNKPG